MNKPKLVFATNNAHKLDEIRSIIGDKVDLLSLADIDCHDDIPETADTLEGNALIKARYIYEKYGLDCFADDTGLEVEALGGAPGTHTARYAYADHNDPEANTRKLLAELEGADNRRARFRTAIALIINGEEHLFEGIVEGEIATEKRGTQGFGYDPLFIPDECGVGKTDKRPNSEGRSYAQLTPDEKDAISHRGNALAEMEKELPEFLAEN